MIEQIDSKGFYIEQCNLPGEGKADDLVPAQHNTIQLCKDRWFVIFETRGFRGVDDNRSVIYQVRKDAPYGPVLSEGCLDKAIQDWDPLGNGRHYVKLCNHSVAFGVPAGALINGQTAPNAGVFVAAWRVNPRVLDRETGYLLLEKEEVLPRETYRCYWIQFKLNEAEDDIDIIQSKTPLRQLGYENGKAICSHEQLVTMNQGYVVPVPYNDRCTEWVFLLHWGFGANVPTSICTPIKFRWNTRTHLYEWVETGPILDGPDDMGIFEGGIVPYGNEWLISIRITPRTIGNVWFRTDDLFGPGPEPFFSDEIRSNCPRTTFVFPDGMVRVMTTDQINSPYQNVYLRRIPLHIMDIDPDHNFVVTKTDVVFDSVKEGLPLSIENAPTMHFCRLLPHTGGNTGHLTYFVRPRAIKGQAYTAGIFKGVVKPEEIQASGVYYSRITYDQDYPATWQF